MKFIYNGNSRKSGIYKIINIQNGRIYIGSAKEFKRRAKQHFSSLKNNKHQNKYLQHDFNKCGEDAFEFHVLEVVEGDKENRRLSEQKYINQYYDEQKQCYNFSPKTIPTIRKKYSNNPEETKKKLSKASKNSWKDPEIRKKRLEGMAKAKPEQIRKQKEVWASKTEEEMKLFREQRRKEATKNWKDPEIRERRMEGLRKVDHSEFAKKRWQNPKYREKAAERIIREGARYWKDNEEAQKKQSEIAKKLWQNPEYRAFFQSEEYKKKQAEYSKQLWSDPKYRKKCLKKTGSLISPEGKVFKDIQDIPSFAKEHNLFLRNVYSVLSGKRKSHKGWRLYKEEKILTN